MLSPKSLSFWESCFTTEMKQAVKIESRKTHQLIQDWKQEATNKSINSYFPQEMKGTVTLRNHIQQYQKH